MNWCHRLLLLVAVVFGAAAANAASGPDLLGFAHKNLRSGAVTDLTKLQGKPVALMFFEPNCSWCIKQARLLQQLQHQCDHGFNSVMLGVHGKFPALKRSLFDLKVELPAYQASKQMVHQLGGIPATPIMLIADDSGHYLTHFRGMTEVAQLQPLLCG